MKTMREYRVVLCVSAAIWLFGPGTATAQDQAITNARIIVGSGQVIDSGTIIPGPCEPAPGRAHP